MLFIAVKLYLQCNLVCNARVLLNAHLGLYYYYYDRLWLWFIIIIEAFLRCSGVVIAFINKEVH